MSLKKIQIIGVFGIFLLSFLFHFMYEWFPNTLFSLIFTVNESIWEHMKLIFYSFLAFGIIDYILLKKYTEFNNSLFNLFIVPVLGIIIYLIIYLPLYNMLGENMIVSIVLLFIVIAIEQIISYYLLKHKEIKYQNIAGIIGILLIFSMFIYFTYNPIHNYIFFDTKNSKYGIDIYIDEK